MRRLMLKLWRGTFQRNRYGNSVYKAAILTTALRKLSPYHHHDPTEFLIRISVKRENWSSLKMERVSTYRYVLMHNFFYSFVFLKSLNYKIRKCACWYDNDGNAFRWTVRKSTKQSHSSSQLLLPSVFLIWSNHPICPNLADWCRTSQESPK